MRSPTNTSRSASAAVAGGYTFDSMVEAGAVICEESIKATFAGGLDPGQTKILKSTQRGRVIVQLKRVSTGKVIVGINDKQCLDSAERAWLSVEVCAELDRLGATKEDLQRCKNLGVFFGCKVGRKS